MLPLCDIASQKVNLKGSYSTMVCLFVFTQIWRAVRLIVDTGLHYFPNFTRENALGYFDKYAWDNTDLAKKEVWLI